MAIIKYTEGATPLLNEHNGYTFQSNHYGQSMFPSSRSSRKRYSHQWKRQHNNQKAVTRWRTMSAETKNAWNNFAAMFPQPTKANPDKFLTGYQCFIRRNSFCFLNFSIEEDFILEPELLVPEEKNISFQIKFSDNAIDATELYIKNFGILPKVGQTLLLYAAVYGEYNGNFYQPVTQQIIVEEIYLDGLFISVTIPDDFPFVVVSVYLSKPVSPGQTYVGTKPRYMGCFTTKKFIQLQDVNITYVTNAGYALIINNDETGIVAINPTTIINSLIPVEKTGWHPEVQNQIIPYWDEVLRDVGFSLTGLSVDFFVLGKKFTRESGKSQIFADTYGRWYVYMDVDGIMQVTQTPWNNVDNDKAMVAMIFWSTTLQRALYKGFEYHNYQMSPYLRAYLHESSPEYISGLEVTINAINNYKIDVADGTITDEDITANIGDGTTGLFEMPLQPFQGQKLYFENTEWKDDIVNPDYITVIQNENVCYNPVSNGLGALIELAAGEFTVSWIIATMDWDNPIKILLGSDKGTTADEAKANNTIESINSLLNDIGFPANETYVLAEIVVQNAGDPYTIVEIVEDFETGADVYVNDVSFDNETRELTTKRTENKPDIIVTIPDEKVKYDADDPAAGYLSEKVVAGTNVTIDEGTGADENKVRINADFGTLGGTILGNFNNNYSPASYWHIQVPKPVATNYYMFRKFVLGGYYSSIGSFVIEGYVLRKDLSDNIDVIVTLDTANIGITWTAYSTYVLVQGNDPASGNRFRQYGHYYGSGKSQ